MLGRDSAAPIARRRRRPERRLTGRGCVGREGTNGSSPVRVSGGLKLGHFVSPRVKRQWLRTPRLTALLSKLVLNVGTGLQALVLQSPRHELMTELRIVSVD